MNSTIRKTNLVPKGPFMNIDQAIERYNNHCMLLGIGSSAISIRKSVAEKNRVKLCNVSGNVVCTISGNPEMPLIKLFKA